MAAPRLAKHWPLRTPLIRVAAKRTAAAAVARRRNDDGPSMRWALLLSADCVGSYWPFGLSVLFLACTKTHGTNIQLCDCSRRGGGSARVLGWGSGGCCCCCWRPIDGSGPLRLCAVVAVSRCFISIASASACCMLTRRVFAHEKCGAHRATIMLDWRNHSRRRRRHFRELSAAAQHLRSNALYVVYAQWLNVCFS